MVRQRVIGPVLLLACALAAAATAAAPIAPVTPPIAGPGLDLQLEAVLEPAQVYVQTQAIYRLRFYQAVDVRDLKISAPSARLADVRPVGSERVYEAERDGRRYRVHERSYAVFPFSSGALALSGAHASGRIAAIAAGAADGRKPVRLEAPAQTLTVLPVPASAGDFAWLPAHALTLTESWSPSAALMRPGEAQRRSIRIEAAGIDAGQIPPLQVAAAGLIVHAEPPRLENRMAGERNIGVREQTFRMVAQRAGELRVPELQLRWWNLDAGAQAVAMLPERRLQVVVADADAVAADVLPMTQAPVAPVSAVAKASPATPPLRFSPKWPELMLAASAMLLIGLLLAVARRPGMRAAWRLQRACRRASAGQVRDGLLQWAATIWPKTPPLTLQALAERLPDPAARRALGALERQLYGPNFGPDDAAALRAAVRSVKRAIRAII
ncbi:MAG: hypothetical protein ABIQ90_15665 [Polaromonas sp.]